MHGILAWNPGHSVGKEPVDELSLSGKPECLSLQESILTDQEKTGKENRMKDCPDARTPESVGTFLPMAKARGILSRVGDFIFRAVTLLIVFIVIAIVVGITWVLVADSMPTIQQAGFGFLTRQDFDPVHNIYGVLPAIYGTLVTSAFALIFAIPIGVGTAIFLVEYCPRPLRIPLAFFADLLAAVPSVVFGLWGFLILARWLQHTGQPWLQQHLGFLPFFQGPPLGVGILAAGMVLTII